MQKIPLSMAREGMVLAKPVVRENGVVLMGEGTQLSAQLIERLAGLEIPKIVVKGRPIDTGAAEKTLSELLEDVEARFSTVSGDKFCAQIKEIVRNDVTRRKQEEEL